MLVEAKAAFYNEETGAVQPWRDIEVTDTLGNELVSEGLVKAIEGGGGGGGDYPKFNVTVTGDGGTFYLYPSTNDDGYTCVFLADSAFNINGVETPNGESVTYSLLSFGDSATLIPGNIIKSVSGDAVYDSDTGYITVTGDCTISGYNDD